MHRSVRAEFVERVVEATKAEVRLGDPFEASTTMGPLNNEAVATKFDTHVADALEKDARLLAGGRRGDRHADASCSQRRPCSTGSRRRC